MNGVSKWMDDPEALRRAIALVAKYLRKEPLPAITSRHIRRATRLLNVHGAGRQMAYEL